ncbi:MAG: hypothetical protein DRI48_09575, partial [Chloroflexi bacterium]
MQTIPLSQIDDNPFQTRQEYDGVGDLAADIKRQGLLQPPVARRVDGRVQLAFGHRRKRAFDLLAQEDPAYQSMPVNIQELTDQDMALYAWSENSQRRDLNPVEEAEAIRRMMNAFGWTQKQVAERIGLSRSALANKLRLLRLPDEALKQLQQGRLSERQALALLPVLELPEPAREQLQDTWYGGQIQAIIEKPDQYSSDRIRGIVGDAIQRVTNDLSTAKFPIDEPFELKGVRASICSACDYRVVRGNVSLCGDITCYDHKDTEWKNLQLARAAEETGLPLTEELSHHDYDYFYFSDKALLEQALDKHCPNLHLVSCSSDYVLGPDGYDNVAYICVHPGKRHCACRQEAAKEARAEEIAAERERKRRLAQIRNQALEQVAAALAEGQTGAMKAVLIALSPWSGPEKIATVTNHHTILQKIAHILVNNAVCSPDPDRAKDQLQKWMEKMGIVSVADAEPDPLADVHRRWARVSAWLGRLTHERPTPEAVRGNLANLE